MIRIGAMFRITERVNECACVSELSHDTNRGLFRITVYVTAE